MSKAENKRFIEAYGRPGAMPAGSTVCALWWQELSLHPSASWEEQLRGKLAAQPQTSSALYYFEGVHDAHRQRSVLYIGRASPNQIRSRLVSRGSLGLFFYPGGKKSNRRREHLRYSDAWDITLRWATFDGGAADLKAVEQLLIRFHKPGYNSQEIKGTVRGNLVVLNVGDKGPLLPVVASWYFAPMARWPDE